MRSGRKFLSILLLAVLVMPLMVSCGDDDEKSEVVSGSELINKAVGTWMCSHSTDTKNGQTYQDLMVGKEVTINTNGTYTSTAQSFGYTGTYSVSGNTITAKSNNGGTFVFSVTFSGNKMVWEGTASNGVSFKYTFNRESENTTQLAFTKDLIAGEFSWEVKDFSFDRGSNGNIQIGKSICFKTDGSCEAFHSMEDAWRINNGRIETYYKRTNEPMYVYTLLSQQGNDITIRLNGTLDDELQATIVLSKEENTLSDVTIEDAWTSKESVLGFYSACYMSCSSFARTQYILEQLRLSSTNYITPSSNEIRETWYNAYQTINRINLFLDSSDKFSNCLTNQEQKQMMAEMRALRAFVYYNISMLWGDVPLVKTAIVDIDANSHYPQSSQYDVLLFACNEIKDVVADLRESNMDSSDKYRLTRDAGYMLIAELEMTLGDYSAALSSLNQIDVQQYIVTRGLTYGTPTTSIIWALKQSEMEAFYSIYTFQNGQLYVMEASGRTEGLERSWQASCSDEYGYWAALKRLGKAQEVTGCSDYQLLMPFPSSEIAQNPDMKQNPGY